MNKTRIGNPLSMLAVKDKLQQRRDHTISVEDVVALFALRRGAARSALGNDRVIYEMLRFELRACARLREP